MSTLEPAPAFIRPDTWAWWEAKRLRYNIALVISGWAAFGLGAVLMLAFGAPLPHWRAGLGVTIYLGVGFLVLMFIANICYLAGALLESVLKPSDVDRFRRRAFALGFWGSMALPFLFPLLVVAGLLVGRSF